MTALEVLLDRLNLHRADRSVLTDVCSRMYRGVSAPASAGWWWAPVVRGKTQLLKIVAGDVWPDEAPIAAAPLSCQRPVARPAGRYPGRDRVARFRSARTATKRYGWNYAALEVVGTGLHRTDIPLNLLTTTQRESCMTLLRAAGIARLAKRRFLTLSYGERRLVLLARVLAWRAAVLILDEVATGLDALNRQRLYRLLRSRRPAGHGVDLFGASRRGHSSWCDAPAVAGGRERAFRRCLDAPRDCVRRSLRCGWKRPGCGS